MDIDSFILDFSLFLVYKTEKENKNKDKIKKEINENEICSFSRLKIFKNF